MRPLAILALVLVPLAACAPPIQYVTRYAPGGGVVVGDRVLFVAEEWRLHEDGRLVVLSCPSEPGATLACERRYIEPVAPEPPPSAAELAAREARSALIRAVASDHMCETVEVQSGSAAEGFWLIVCGTQRFYRREGDTWIDRTPAE